jgi:hypothetical protein
MVNKNKKYKTYKGAGVDLEKDADRPALRTGKRIAKESGKTYYEYRANRIDVKQPPKKYPKLEKGGKLDEMVEKYQMWLDKNNLPQMSADELLVDESVNLTKEQRKYIQNFSNEWDEEQDKYAKGGQTDDFYDNLQVHVQGVGTIYHGQSMKAAIKKADAYLLKNPKAEVVIVDEKYGDEYDLEGNQVENEDEYARGGEITKDNLKIGDRIESKESDYGVYVVKSLYNKNPHIWEIRNNRGERVLGEGELKFWKFSNKMAKGGFVAVGEKDGYWTIMSKPTTEEKAQQMLDLGGLPRGEVGKVVTLEQAKAHKNTIGKEYLEKGGYMEKGGISQKEVAESNAEMVLSQIKAVKHHAQELSNVVSKNSDIEAWVVAKIERASTDLSDITHYLEFQTKKMAMGGEIHRTQD